MASKVLQPEGRALTYRAKAAWSVARTDAAKHFGGVGRDSTVTRSCLATGETLLVPSRKSTEQGNRITGNTGKAVDGERDSAGSVVAPDCSSSEHNLMGASTRRCPGGEQVWRYSSVTVWRGVCLTHQRRHKHEREGTPSLNSEVRRCLRSARRPAHPGHALRGCGSI